MGDCSTKTVGIQKDVIRALLASTPGVMDIANQLDLTPREVRDILQENLIQLGGSLPQPNSVIPTAGRIPSDFPNLSGGLRRLMSKEPHHS